MSRKRLDTDREPISDLFGDVVGETGAFLFHDGARDGDGAEDGARASAAARLLSVDPRSRRRDGRELHHVRAAALAAVSLVPHDAVPEYEDDRGRLSAAVILNGAATVLTLGLWAPWLKAGQRRAICAHTRIDGAPLVHSGRGGELLRGLAGGLLFALALAAALLAALDAAGAFAPGASPAAPLVAAVALTPLGPYAAFRWRRHALRRTEWRGLRFGLDGSPLAMARLWLLWAPVLALSAGLLWPLWRWARERRLSAGIRWGTARVEFAGSGWRLLPHWLPLWAALAALAALSLSPELRAAAGLEAPAARLMSRGPLGAAAAVGAGLIGLWLLWCNYRAAEMREVWAARSLAGARLRCGLSLWHLADAGLAAARRNVWPGALVYLLGAAAAALPLFGAARVELAGAAPPLLEGLRLTLPFGLAPELTGWPAQTLVLLGAGLEVVLVSVFLIWLRMAVHAAAVHAHLCASLRILGAHKLEAARREMTEEEAAAPGDPGSPSAGA